MLFVLLPGPLNIIKQYFKETYHVTDEARVADMNEIRTLLENGAAANPRMMAVRQNSTNIRNSI